MRTRIIAEWDSWGVHWGLSAQTLIRHPEVRARRQVNAACASLAACEHLRVTEQTIENDAHLPSPARASAARRRLASSAAVRACACLSQASAGARAVVESLASSACAPAISFC